MEITIFRWFVIGYGILNPAMAATTSDSSVLIENELGKDIMWFWCQVKDIQNECNAVDDFDYCVGIKFKGIFWSATHYGGLGQFETRKLGSILVNLPCSTAVKQLMKIDGSIQDALSVTNDGKNDDMLVIPSGRSVNASHTIPEPTVDTGAKNASIESTTSEQNNLQLVPPIMSEGTVEAGGMNASIGENISGDENSQLVPAIMYEGTVETGGMNASIGENISGKENFQLVPSIMPKGNVETGGMNASIGENTSREENFQDDFETERSAYWIDEYWVVASVGILVIIGIVFVILLRYGVVKLEAFHRCFAFVPNRTARPMTEVTRL